MKTHDNRALFSKALLKAATCFFLIAGAGMSPVFALQGTAESMKMEITQQTVTVSGVVKDRKGEPIIGANIMEKGTTNGTITDFDGKYRLNVKGSQSVLVISYIGYKTQEFEVKNNRKIDVTLQEDTEVMDEVVVIGYGTQRKGDVTSAVASVKAEDFTVGKIGDAADLIKGKVAGLSIAKGSGDPNATSTIRLRGVISVNGSTTPLILIDGVEGDLSTVAPENIASIDVLKDASAAAIYGTRGANGVILITTQNGKRESHTTASYSGYVSASQFGKKLEFMTAEDIRAGKTNFTDKGYDTDWLDAVSRTGFTHNHNFNITGGSKQTTYSADVTYRKEDGVIMNTYSEDIRMRFDVSHWMLNDMLKVNLNMVKKWHKNSATNATATDQSNIYRQAIMRNPTAPIYNEDGSYNEDFNVNYYYNPVGMLEERLGNYTYEETRATGNVTFEPVKGWQTNLMVATSRFNAHDKGYNTTDYFSNQLNEWTGYAYHTQDETRTDNLELTSKYDLNVGKHRMNALVGYSYQYYTYERFYANNYNFPTDFYQWHNLGLGQALKDGKAGMGSDKNENTLIGFFARVSYAFDNKYNLLVSVRQEGSSKFGDNNKWGTFPSASLGWTISNEGFMEGITWLNNLKLRAGFGITGVIPNDPYMSLTRYNYGSSYYYDKGTWKPGLEVASNPNPDLKWEKSTEYNIGLDFSVLNDRLGGSVDIYRKKTTDLLFNYSVPTPPNLYSYTFANGGSVRNQGIEVAINAIPVQTKDFEWKTVVTVAHNASKLLSLSNDMYESNSYMDTCIRESTRKNYFRTLDTLGEYAPEAAFCDIDKTFVCGYERFLCSMGMKANTIVKHMKHLKKAPRQACLKGYVKHSIEELFSLCNVKPEKTFRESLTTKELVVLYQFLENNFDTMEEKEREILSGLLFSCLTGLRYSDICSVEYSNIKRIRNKRWLFLTMKKTSQKVFIPIEQMFSGKALGIIKLFHRTRGKLFHMPSNAICNRVIKRVYKKFFRSRKNISFHLAKHSKNYI